jgi:hypothetical protein
MGCGNSSQNINKTFIIEPPEGDNTSYSACTGIYTNQLLSCSGDTKIEMSTGEIKINNDLLPDNPNSHSIGSPLKRFRELNAISGSVSVWSATTRTHTPEVHLGQDSSGNTRTITADNSIIRNDILLGGSF